MRGIRLCREGSHGSARQRASEFAPTAEAIKESGVDMCILGRTLQEASDKSVVADLASLERARSSGRRRGSASAGERSPIALGANG